ncbi:hypothetical protein SH584_04130 [Sphingomonas sp. LY29]|uniref:hypothetical protein n=1 Tax=Sphingomonas sp. LY29 TaxID=3095341 RepID=UPI002D76FEC8|nr:hypothetical protein [Sphingomonas sp. LY29]WRP26630.1 hypothetical protein SH584_04130 [Sphingomonas sp. LY29]
MDQIHQIVAAARPGNTVVGWKLPKADRRLLLHKYARSIADHVTLAAKVAADTPLPDDTDAFVIGHVDDIQGLEALVVSIEGSPARPDGSTFHITWSLAPGRQAKESNDVLAAMPWTSLEQPISIRLIGGRLA